MTQDEALALLKTGASIFLTGQPGSGKTHTVNRYIQGLQRQGVEFAYTASTGIAATWPLRQRHTRGREEFDAADGHPMVRTRSGRRILAEPAK
jgi:DNA replication protein DnaC